MAAQPGHLSKLTKPCFKIKDEKGAEDGAQVKLPGSSHTHGHRHTHAHMRAHTRVYDAPSRTSQRWTRGRLRLQGSRTVSPAPAHDRD